MDTLLEFLSQPFTVMIIVGLFVALLTYLFTANPSWAKYEGILITAIKFAEKAIPDNTSNKSAARFDAALKETLRQYQQVYNTAPPTWLQRAFALAIPIVHDALEQRGTLDKKTETQ